jgi:hypothetical protein
MALVLKDRVQETTTTTGTGVITLDGATTGFQAFSAVGSGNDTYYTITDGTNWEVGVGMYANVPSPALSLDFSAVTTLPAGITFTRATDGTYFDSSGLLQTAGSDVARFDHRLESGVWVNKGLLIEESRTNIMQRSEVFNDAYYTKSNATVTADATAAPTGSISADRIVENTTNATHFFYRDFSLNATSQVYSLSIFVKANQRFRFALQFSSNVSPSPGGRLVGNLNNETFSAFPIGTGATLVNSFSQKLADGWYRVGFSVLTGVNQTHRAQFNIYNDAGASTYAGSTANGIYAWGMQLEAGNFGTSYIHTPSTANVTRNADVVSMTSTDFSSWFNQPEGTMFTQYDFTGLSSANYAWDITQNGTTNERHVLTAINTDVTSRVAVVDGNVTQAILLSPDPATTPAANTTYRHAYAYKVNDFAATLDGRIPTIDTAGTVPAPNRIELGQDRNNLGVNSLNGHLAKFYYWNTRLSNGTLQFLSGTGTLSSGNYLWRTNPVSSSNSNALVNWGAGTKTVFSPLPAQATLGSAATADNSSIGTNQYAWANFKKALDQGVVGGVAYSDENTNGIVSTYSLVSTSTAINHVGGVLAPNGDVHFIPYNNVRGQKLSAAGVVSTYSLVYTVANAYGGGVLAGNGDIHFVPTQAARGQKVSASGVVSTYSLVYTTNTAYFGGVLAPNGDIHFVPTQAARGQKVSAAGVVSTYSLVYTTGTGGGYLGGCLAPNGDIHFIPRNAPVGQKISAAGVVSTYSLVYTTSDAYRGGVLSPNGDIHFIPFNAAVGQKISAAGVVSTYALAATFSAGGYNSGVLAPNGDIHFIPANATVGQRISVNGTPYTYSLVYTIASGFGGGILRPDGSIVFAPQTAAVGQIISTNPGSPLGLEECLSSYLNKF